MKVENIVNGRGNKVANQFIITHEFLTIFQSYETVIARKFAGSPKVEYVLTNLN